MFIEQVRGWFPEITPSQIEQQLDDHYASWFKEYVSFLSNFFVEIVYYIY